MFIMNDVAAEAQILGGYILKGIPSDTVITAYSRIVEARQDGRQTSDRLLDFALRHRWAMPLLDSATALIRPEAELRYRLYVMFAILECQPMYSDRFLSQRHSRPYIVVIMLVGCKAVVKAMCGLVLLKALRI
jgi:hypothetical protein